MCSHRPLNYLNVNNITPSQSGSMPGDSTVNQLTSIYHDLCTSFDQGITTQSNYYYYYLFIFDISKAFDRVWHKGLLKRKKKKKKRKKEEEKKKKRIV